MTELGGGKSYEIVLRYAQLAPSSWINWRPRRDSKLPASWFVVAEMI